MLCTIAFSGSISHFMNINYQSQYADRLPIGLEKVIQTFSPEIVKRFYTKWYNLQNMAVIVVGDFTDMKSAITISCKSPVIELRTIKDYRDLVVEAMFYHVMNQRFFKISRKKDPTFLSCSVAADVVVQPIKAYIMTSSCKEKGTLIALESMLTEHFLRMVPVVGIEYEAQLQKTILPHKFPMSLISGSGFECSANRGFTF
ncbi:putative metalloenzyme, LuxS/M16 peptidase [Helianthus annuus]|nr:putative metalloenzyme, LuxS/M16 peptidase [Helianthus annuus]KAJ0865956.1 putative metalloenzyme, LuxS/M16 peptidase [Helianthus annuus]